MQRHLNVYSNFCSKIQPKLIPTEMLLIRYKLLANPPVSKWEVS